MLYLPYMCSHLQDRSIFTDFLYAFQITNQMVTMCRVFLTDDFKRRIWELPKREMIKLMEECLNLYSRYHASFSKTKQAVADSTDETSFDCSEMYVFGKFETFKERLEKVQQCILFIRQALHSLTLLSIHIHSRYISVDKGIN